MPGEAGAGRPRPPCRAVVRRRDGGRHRRGSRSARSSATLPTTGRCRSAAPARWRVCSRRRSPARRVFRVAAGIRPAAAGDHRREPRAARAATDRTGRPCLGARRGVAPAPRRRARGDARTRGRGRRVQGGVRTPGRRGEPHRSAAVACAAGRDARRGRALSRLTGTADPRPCCLQPGRQRSARGCGPEIAALPEVVEAARPRRTPTHEPPGPAARCRAVGGQEGREESAVGRSVPGGDGGGRDVHVPAAAISAMARIRTPSSAMGWSPETSSASRKRCAASRRWTAGQRHAPSPNRPDTPLARAMPTRRARKRRSPSPWHLAGNRRHRGPHAARDGGLRGGVANSGGRGPGRRPAARGRVRPLRWPRGPGAGRASPRR